MEQKIDFETLYNQSQSIILLLNEQLKQTNAHMEEMTETIKQLNLTIQTLQDKNKLLQESVDYLTRKLYCPKSETAKALGFEQLSLFDEAEVEADPKAEQYTDDDMEDISYQRKKRNKKKYIDKFKDVPHKKVLVHIPEDDRICDRCGSILVPVGEEFVRYELNFIPAKLEVRDIYRVTYECRSCRKENGNSYMVNSDVPDSVIPHSFASPASVAYVMKQKFVNGVPLYRQETEWMSMGVELSRQTMSNWILKASELYLMPLVDRMHELLIKEKYAHADETPVQVLNEPGRKNTTKSFMWVYSTIKESETPIRIFDYQPTRKGTCPEKFLKGFKGCLISDAYIGYNGLKNVTRCYCWAHARSYA